LNPIAAGCLLILMPVEIASAKPVGEEWILEQFHEDGGACTAYVCYDSMKVVCTRTDCHTLLIKAPDWQVWCFSPAQKVKWHCRLDQFNGQMLYSPYADGHKNRNPVRASGFGNLKGLPFTKYTLVNAQFDVLHGANPIRVRPEVSEFACRYFDVTDIPKVPLYCRHDKGWQAEYNAKDWSLDDFGSDLRQGFSLELKTMSWKKIPLRKSDFVVPEGLRAVREIGLVAFSAAQRDAMEGFVDDMGLSSEVGQSVKSQKKREAENRR